MSNMIPDFGMSVLSGGMMLQADKTQPSRNGAFPETTPLSQVGTAAEVRQAGQSSMLPSVPSISDIWAKKGSLDIYA